MCLLDEETTAVVGREAPCEIVVSDSSISRQHARFSIRKSEVWVEDLDSRNGALFRGRRIQRERLEPTDEIHVGRARLVLVATREGTVPASERHSKQASSNVVIVNPSMKTLYEQAARASRGSLPVLILGETGVGKEHVAAAFHRQSDRHDGPFVVVNCAAIPSSLLEPTLFGHERGAFTGAVTRAIGVFERANGGVLFLDEIGKLTLGAQAALLRAIETRRIPRVGASTELAVDVRIVAATHCDLDAMVEDGTFRQDLWASSFRAPTKLSDPSPSFERYVVAVGPDAHTLQTVTRSKPATDRRATSNAALHRAPSRTVAVHPSPNGANAGATDEPERERNTGLPVANEW